MNRKLTNIIRFFMDECLPPIVRDSKVFMYPFYLYAYRGKNIKQAMQFKKLVRNFTPEEYAKFYRELDTISRNRITDLSIPCLEYIEKSLEPCAKTLLDVGCGKGFFLDCMKKRGIEVHGVDVLPPDESRAYPYTQSWIDKLPFSDKQFDVVSCIHTLEHILELEGAIKELKRVAARQLVVVVPCQRQFFYTLDEHVNFFPYAETLTGILGIADYDCRKIWGDWVYIGYPHGRQAAAHGSGSARQT